MTILEKIIERKHQEVAENKSRAPVSKLGKSDFFYQKTRSLKDSIISGSAYGIIAEFKRCSPSAGTINEKADPGMVAKTYENAGASAVSVLTDHDFFGGSPEDLTEIRGLVNLPLLRKDFIIDEYQLLESRAIGADAVLLIADVLPAKKLKQLHDFAKSLHLEALVEIHDEKYLDRIPANAEIIGINSRNLSTFDVDIAHLSGLINQLPGSLVRVAESGISSAKDYFSLKTAGFNAFLIGGFFMKTQDPGEACKSFIQSIRQ
jgi:indole-3-glycerol phosphate synthase